MFSNDQVLAKARSSSRQFCRTLNCALQKASLVVISTFKARILGKDQNGYPVKIRPESNNSREKESLIYKYLHFVNLTVLNPYEFKPSILNNLSNQQQIHTKLRIIHCRIAITIKPWRPLGQSPQDRDIINKQKIMILGTSPTS